MTDRPAPRILVVGGGFGGLETAFYLRRRLGRRAEITLISDKSYFVYKPSLIYVPFGLDPESLQIELRLPASSRQVRFINERAQSVDTGRQVLQLANMQEHPYDYLVIATGARVRPFQVPGMWEHAHIIRNVEEMLRLRRALAQITGQAANGMDRRLLFLVPPDNWHAGPLYELLFITDTWLRQQGLRERVSLTLATAESSYLEAFGPRLHQVMLSEMVERDIEHRRGIRVTSVEHDSVSFDDGQSLPYNLLVTYPPQAGAANFPSLPLDEHEFIQVDPATRRVQGQQNIYAVGDAGSFPLKLAYLAVQQADVVTEQIAAAVHKRKARLFFEPEAMVVVDQAKKATFVQVPLSDDGQVLYDSSRVYQIGESPFWRGGKQLMASYLPWRFGAGNPVHGGLPWLAISLGRRLLARLQAH